MGNVEVRVQLASVSWLLKVSVVEHGSKVASALTLWAISQPINYLLLGGMTIMVLWILAHLCTLMLCNELPVLYTYLCTFQIFVNQ